MASINNVEPIKPEKKDRRIHHIFLNDVELKTCCKCKNNIILTEFYRDVIRWDMLSRTCKDCTKEQFNLIPVNKEKRRIRQREYQAKRRAKLVNISISDDL